MQNIVLLIFIPLVFSVSFLLTSNKKIYKLLSWLIFIILATLSVLTLLKGTQSFSLTGQALEYSKMTVLAVELILTAFILYKSIQNKRWFTLLLGLIQLASLGYSALYMKDAITFNTDRLSLVMMLIVNIIGTLIIIYSNGYMNTYEEHRKMKSRQKLFYFTICIFLSAMNGLIFGDALSLVYFFWEITTITSFILISYNNDQEAINSGFRALTLNMIGGICFFAAIVILDKYYGIGSLTQILHGGKAVGFLVAPIFLLCIAGFTKSAQLPFESWLLGAMVAPTPVSALLHSSTMVNAGVYLIVKLSPAYAGTRLGTMIAIYGAFTFFLCSLLAVLQRNAKRILAYSTIANLGLVISSAGMGTSVAISAAIMLIIYHAISKALLFLCAGEIEHVVGSRDVEEMQGLIDKCPKLALLAAFGMMSMLLPPFGVLITKWISIEASSTDPIVAVLLVLGSALTSFFWIKFAGTILTHTKSKVNKWTMDFYTAFPLEMLSIAIILTAVFISQIFNLYISPEVTALLNVKDNLVINAGSVTSNFGAFNDAFVFIVLAVLAVLFILVRKVISSADIKRVYMCGENNNKDDENEFRNVNCAKTDAHVSNFYLSNIFNEKSWSLSGTVISILMILFVMVGGLLCLL